MPAGAHRATPLWATITGYSQVYWDTLRRRHQPSPLFDLQTGEAVAAPVVLAAAEVGELKARSCDPD